jgi:hypothetical protein
MKRRSFPQPHLHMFLAKSIKIPPMKIQATRTLSSPHSDVHKTVLQRMHNGIGPFPFSECKLRRVTSFFRNTALMILWDWEINRMACEEFTIAHQLSYIPMWATSGCSDMHETLRIPQKANQQRTPKGMREFSYENTGRQRDILPRHAMIYVSNVGKQLILYLATKCNIEQVWSRIYRIDSVAPLS